MNERLQQLAIEIAETASLLNRKFQEAENNGLNVVAKVNEFINLEDSSTDKSLRIEVALLQPITPDFEKKGQHE